MVVRRKNRTSTGLDLTPAKTLVAYKNGNWHDPAIWKDEDTDLPIAMTPRKIDNVKIIGFTVTAQDNIECNNLTVGASNQTVSSVLDVTDKTVDTYGDITFAGKSDVLTRVSPGWGTWNVRGDWTLNNGSATVSYVFWGTAGQAYLYFDEVTRPTIRYLDDCTLSYIQDNSSNDARALYFAQSTYIADGVTLTLKATGDRTDLYHTMSGGYFIMGAGSTVATTKNEGLHSVSDGTNVWSFGAGTTMNPQIYFGIDGRSGVEILQEIDFTGLTWEWTTIADTAQQKILTGVHHQGEGTPAVSGGIKLLSDVTITNKTATVASLQIATSNNPVGTHGDTWSILDLNGHTFHLVAEDPGGTVRYIFGLSSAGNTHQHGQVRFNGGVLKCTNVNNGGGILVQNSRDDTTNGNLCFDFSGDGGYIDLIGASVLIEKTTAGVFDTSDVGDVRIKFKALQANNRSGVASTNPLPRTQLLIGENTARFIRGELQDGLYFYDDLIIDAGARIGIDSNKTLSIATGKKIQGSGVATKSYIQRATGTDPCLITGDTTMLDPAGGFNISNCTYGSGGNLTATGSTDGGGNTNITFE